MANGSGAWNLDKCFACGKGKLMRLEHKMVVACFYCGIEFTEQLLAIGDPKMIVEQAKSMWTHRLNVTQSMSTEALLDILAARGVPVPAKMTLTDPNELSKAINPNLLNDLQSELAKQIKITHIHIGPDEPDLQFIDPPVKHWSYEEAAASEFNVTEGEGGLA